MTTEPVLGDASTSTGLPPVAAVAATAGAGELLLPVAGADAKEEELAAAGGLVEILALSPLPSGPGSLEGIPSGVALPSVVVFRWPAATPEAADGVPLLGP
jgi:hypothetical protein